MKIGRVLKKGVYIMSNVVKKGDFLVFIGADDEVKEFFISSAMFDLDNCFTGITGRKNCDHCFGFRLRDGYFYQPGTSYWVDRKATLEECDKFIQWMEEKGHKFNLNILELTLNK